MKTVYNVGIRQIEVVRGGLRRYDADALVLPASSKGEFDISSFSCPSTLECNASEELKNLMALEGIDNLPPASVYLTDVKEQIQYVMYIIHAVTTGHGRGHGRSYPKRNIIADCTKNALDLANKTGLESAGFPLLGSSYDNIPLDEIIETMGKEFVQHLQGETSINRVGLVLGTNKRYSVANAVFDRLLPH